MICAVVMDGIAAEVAVFIHIPSAVINIPFAVKAVPNVAARNLLISHATAVPKSQITDNENGTGELDVQIGALVVQIVAVQFIHQRHTLGFGEVGVLFLQVLSPVIVVNVIAPNDVSAVLHCVRPSLSAIRNCPNSVKAYQFVRSKRLSLNRPLVSTRPLTSRFRA